MEKKQDHPTKRIIIKTAEVDVLMVPLIEWLNSFDSITTAFCCQGELRGEEIEEEYCINKPYVMFTCINSIDLISVLSIFEYYSLTEIHWNEQKSQIEYITRFNDQEALLTVIDTIETRRRNLRKRRIHN